MNNIVSKLVSWYYGKFGLFHANGKRFNRWFYGTGARLIPDETFLFMNLGYEPLDPEEPVPDLKPPDELDRHSIQLYYHLIRHSDIADKDVLEVGSGRGGGSSYIRRYHRPRSLVSLDLTPENVERCRDRYKDPGFDFRIGDAEDLPLSDSEVDTVINVESCHCYPSMTGKVKQRSRFLDEVYRVLRPGGRLLLTDLRRGARAMDQLRNRIEGSRFEIEREWDILENVMASRRRMADDRDFDLRIRAWAESSAAEDKEVMYHAIRGVFWFPGSANFATLENGETCYRSWILRKPA